MKKSHLQHVIESQQFDRKRIEKLFSVADTLEQKHDSPLRGKIMASLFYEPSTRTRFSFEAAMHRLGGSVITTENAKEFSSMTKGETLEDSIRVVSGYVDVIVIRHDEKGSAKRASLVSDVPVINAGDGSGQHPTQALLDLYTIRRELGRIDGIRVAFVGDLKHGRTIRSLSFLLGKFKDVTIWFVSPKGLRVGKDIRKYLDTHSTPYFETEDFCTVATEVDVVYQTRIQKERFKSMKEYETFRGCYKIDLALARRMKRSSIIMHPLPRVDEILTEVDASPKAVYFKQARYGLLVRMALIQELLGE